MRVLLAAAAAFLSACAPATVEGLRQEHAAHRTFEIDRNYQTVYRAILDQTRKCFAGGRVVEGDLYTDRKSGHVALVMFGDREVLMAADIVAQGDGRSKVDVYAAPRSWAWIAGRVEEWVRDGSTDCDAQLS